MSFDVKQTWWHVEDILHPDPSHKIRQVMDIYVDDCNDQIIDFTLPNYIAGLRVYARNLSNRELGYIVEGDGNGAPYNLQVQLPSISEFPKVNGKNLRHVKIEIEYIKIILKDDSDGISTRYMNINNSYPTLLNKKNMVDLFHFRKPKVISIDTDNTSKNNQGIIKQLCEKYMLILGNIIRPKVDCNLTISGIIRPEFYITMPLGWEIETKFTDRFKKTLFNKSSEGKAMDLKVSLETHTHQPRGGPIPLELAFPYIHNVDGKRTYNYTLSKDGTVVYESIFQQYKSLSAKNIPLNPEFTLTYAAEMSTMLTILSWWLPIAFIFAGGVLLIFTIYCQHSSTKDVTDIVAPYLSYLLALCGYLYTYFTFVKEGYYIPFTLKTMIFIGIFIILIGISSGICMSELLF